jgi:hypothetical protein
MLTFAGTALAADVKDSERVSIEVIKEQTGKPLIGKVVPIDDAGTLQKFTSEGGVIVGKGTVTISGTVPVDIQDTTVAVEVTGQPIGVKVIEGTVTATIDRVKVTDADGHNLNLTSDGKVPTIDDRLYTIPAGGILIKEAIAAGSEVAVGSITASSDMILEGICLAASSYAKAILKSGTAIKAIAYVTPSNPTISISLNQALAANTYYDVYFMNRADSAQDIALMYAARRK